MAGNIKGITIEIGGNTVGLNKALGEVNKETNKLKRELNDVEKLLKLDPTNTELLAQKHKLLGDSIGKTKDKLDSLKLAQEQAQKQLANGDIGEEEYRKLQREIVKTEQDLKKLEEQAKTTGDKIGQIGDKIGKFGKATGDLGNKMLPVSGIIAGLGIAAVTTSNQFDDAMAKIYTIAEESILSVSEMQTQIELLSNETGISVNALSEDVYNAISAGQSTADAVNFVAESSRLAKGGFAASAQALDILTTTLNAYGMESKEVTKVSDMLIQTQNKGKTTVGELSNNMGKVIPTANSYNVSLEQLCTSFAIMTVNGIKTAETTTFLNSMINELGKSGTKASIVIENQTKKTFAQLMDEGKSLADVLTILDSVAQESGISMGDMFGSADAGKAAITLLSGGVENFNVSVTEMQNSTGATQKAFEKMQTPAEEFKITLNQLKNAGLEFGRALQPLFVKLTKALKDLVNGFKKLSPKMIETITTGALIVAAIAPLLILIGKISTGISKLIPIIAGLWTIISAHPIGALITVLGLAVGALIVFGSNIDKTGGKIDDLVSKNNELEESTKKLIDDVERDKKAREENKEAIESQVGASKILADELYKLADKENLTNTEKTKMKMLVDQLNENMPDLNLLIDEETGKLSKNRDEVEKSIVAQEKLLKTKAAQEDMAKIAERMYTAEKNRAKAIAISEDIVKKRNELEKEHSDLLKVLEGQDANGEVSRMNARKSISEVNASLKGLQGELSVSESKMAESQTALEELETEFQTASDYVNKNSSAIRDNSTANSELAVNVELVAEKNRMLGGQLPFNIEKFTELNNRIEANTLAAEKSTTATEQLIVGNIDLGGTLETTGLTAEETATKFEAYADKAQNAFSKISQDSKVSVDEMTANLNSNADVLEKWAVNLETISTKGIDDGLLAKLKAAGPEASKTVEGLVTASETQINSLNTAFQRGGEAAVDALLGEFGAKRVKDGGTQLSTDIGTGIVENKAPQTAAERVVFETKVAAMNKITACKFETVGDRLTNDMVTGIKNGTHAVVTAVQTLVQQAYAVASGGKVSKNADGTASYRSTPLMANGGVLTRGSAIVGENGAEMISMANGKAIVRPLMQSEKLIANKANAQQVPGNGEILSALNELTRAVKANQTIEVDGYAFGRVVRNANNSNNAILGV